MRTSLRRVGGIGLATLALWSLGDAVSSSVTHSFCRKHAIASVAADAEFQALLGAPVLPGSWYDDSIAFSHDGHIASCGIRFDGARRSSDVVVKAIRDDGWGTTLLYNTIGPRRWTVLTCEATQIDSQGRLRRIELRPSQRSRE